MKIQSDKITNLPHTTVMHWPFKFPLRHDSF